MHRFVAQYAYGTHFEHRRLDHFISRRQYLARRSKFIREDAVTTLPPPLLLVP